MASTSPPQIIIIGAGPAGLGAAAELKRLGHDFKIFEQQSRPIGRCQSHERSGVFFDEGPHISFTKSAEIKDLFNRNADGKVNTLTPRLSNFWKGLHIPHPVQEHLAFVPDPLRSTILKEIQATYVNTPSEYKNFEDWLVHHFGRTFFEEFTAKYTRKYWTTEAHNLTTDWVSNRIQRPDFKIIESGARSKDAQSEHYFTEFRYPFEGGYQTFLQKTANAVMPETRLSARVTKINSKEKWVEINGAERHYYQHLIHSIPLDMLSELEVDIPSPLTEAASKLNCSSATLYNIIYKSHCQVTTHWGYVYDEDICFSRYYFPKVLINQNTDPVQGVQAEIYSSRYKPLSNQVDNVETVIKGFVKIGLFKASDVIDIQKLHLRHANVIFDRDRANARDALMKYFYDCDIHGVGRYGSWRYLWSDESYLDGQSAVRTILNAKDKV